MFQLLPEWSRQQQVLIAWPHSQSDWVHWLSQAEQTYIQLTQAICEHAQALILVTNASLKERVRELLDTQGINQDRYQLVVMEYQDTWARDFGPITLGNETGGLKMLDFTFNGWGGKFAADLDNQVNRRLQQAGVFGNVPMETVDLVLEGGGIEVDSKGTLLTTSHCLLTPTRNPQFNQQQIEEQLSSTLGVQRVLWLNEGHLTGDDTDGHIDTLARFCDDRSICYQACDQEHHPDYHSLQKMATELSQLRDFQQQTYELIPLPMPSPTFNQEGELLPASYANFLILNNAVLAPVYQVKEDDSALRQLEIAYPKHRIVPVNCATLIQQFGSLHCVTMQIPIAQIPAAP